MVNLTAEQCRALDLSPDVPARFVEPESQIVAVLLRSDDFDWVRNLLKDEPDAPRRTDPRTGIEFAVLPEARYERFKAFFEEDPLTKEERQALLRDAGTRAGWNDPVWDIKEES